MRESKTVRQMTETPVYDEEQMKLLISQIAKNLKNARLAAGVSVQKLAMLTGITESHIYRMEKSGRVGIDCIMKIVVALGVEPEEWVPLSLGEQRQTYGNRFEAIVQGLPPADVNCVLSLARAYADQKNKRM